VCERCVYVCERDGLGVGRLSDGNSLPMPQYG
jgi:hypothetical protein